MVNHRYLGTSDIARICQVTSVTVGNWIRSGKLKASRVPGGNYRVTAAELVRFLQDTGMAVPSGLISQQPRVLIVSDDPAATGRFSSILADIGRPWHIDTACDCLTAGAKVVQTGPDLVILRLPMAGMDTQVCEQICRTSAWMRCKLLVILTPGEPAELAEAQQIGADRCLGKDFADDEFRSAVLELLFEGALPPEHFQKTSQKDD
ncbi:MAG: helix-turn-helix domain-containing protein [Phycisphaerae bacterium]|nr:helix-turn-helix domain-containing protein [Phycisphaerae bacterium]